MKSDIAMQYIAYNVTKFVHNCIVAQIYLLFISKTFIRDGERGSLRAQKSKSCCFFRPFQGLCIMYNVKFVAYIQAGFE